MPYDLAPTSSTTAALVMGDALAITLLQKRNFTQEDFAMFHPGGNLGKRLLLKVEMLMITGANVPVVKESVSLSDAIIEISSKRLGATCVVDKSGVLCGILTDGDLRRLLQRTTNITNLTASPGDNLESKNHSPEYSCRSGAKSYGDFQDHTVGGGGCRSASNWLIDLNNLSKQD